MSTKVTPEKERKIARGILRLIEEKDITLEQGTYAGERVGDEGKFVVACAIGSGLLWRGLSVESINSEGDARVAFARAAKVPVAFAVGMEAAFEEYETRDSIEEISIESNVSVERLRGDGCPVRESYRAGRRVGRKIREKLQEQASQRQDD